MAKRNLFEEIRDGFESLAAERDDKITLRKTELRGVEPVSLSGEEVVNVREKLHFSQQVFARVIRANPRTYPRWEKEGTSGPQAALIKLLGKHPELVGELETL